MCFTDGGKIGGVKCQNMLLRPKFIIRIAVLLQKICQEIISHCIMLKVGPEG